MRVPIGKPNGRKTKLAALVIVLAIEITAVYYDVYASPNTYTGPTYVIPTSTTHSVTTTTSATVRPPPPNVLVLKSALINNGTLILDMQNKGPSETTDMVVTNICSPGFVNCMTYGRAAGRSYQSIYVLPVGREFKANFTGICFFPIVGCSHYFPVATSSYYIDVRFDFVKGNPVYMPIVALANNTWARRTSVTNITSSITGYVGNLTGRLNVTVTVDNNIYFAVNYTTSINTWRSSSSGYNWAIVSNKTGCGGSLANDCSTPIPGVTTFNLVQTGVYPGAYYAVVVRDLNVTSTYFAAWDKVLGG